MALIWENSDFVLYYMTPIDTVCDYFESEEGSDSFECKDGKLKLYEKNNNVIHYLADAVFTGGEKLHAVFLKQEKKFLIFGGDDSSKGKYISYSPATDASPKIHSDGNFLYEWGNLLSFKSSSTFSVENLADHSVKNCEIDSPELKKYFSSNFDEKHLFLAPNGAKMFVLKGNNTFDFFELTSCFREPKEFKAPPGISDNETYFKYPEWYNGASFIGFFSFGGFGLASFTPQVLLYDTHAKGEVVSRQMEQSESDGFLWGTNYLDHPAIVLFDKATITAVPEEGSVAIVLHDQGEDFIINQFADTSSTKAFYEIQKKIPAGINARQTSYQDVFGDLSVPHIRIEAQRDGEDDTLFHVVVINDTDLRQIFDLKLLQERSDITVKELMNMSYNSGAIKLTNGFISGHPLTCKTEYCGDWDSSISLATSTIAFGDLNGDGSVDAAVVLRSYEINAEDDRPEGIALVSIVVNKNGKPENIATVDLRSQAELTHINSIVSMNIKDGFINMRVSGGRRPDGWPVYADLHLQLTCPVTCSFGNSLIKVSDKK